MRMPIYEFRCELCEARFESLVPAGTDSFPCAKCGAERTVRVLSSPGAPMRLAKSAGARQTQESRNAKLHSDTKERFKARRRKAREGRSSGPPRGAA
jgi:putative FmdB family regulatory protein